MTKELKSLVACRDLFGIWCEINRNAPTARDSEKRVLMNKCDCDCVCVCVCVKHRWVCELGPNSRFNNKNRHPWQKCGVESNSTEKNPRLLQQFLFLVSRANCTHTNTHAYLFAFLCLRMNDCSIGCVRLCLCTHTHTHNRPLSLNECLRWELNNYISCTWMWNVHCVTCTVKCTAQQKSKQGELR